jgi:hypothetical protein
MQMTGNPAVVVRAKHQTSLVLQPCMRAAVAVQHQPLVWAAVVAWGAQAVAVLAPVMVRILWSVLRILVVVVVVVNLGMEQPEVQALSLHVT